MAQQKTNTTPSQPSKVISPIRRSESQIRPYPQGDPTPDQIAKRAYEIFLTRGSEHGHDQDDWFQAEQELRLA